MDKYDRKLATAIVIVAVYLFLGMVFFRFYEDLGWVDAFYFTGSTLTTVGYGDITPHTDLGKIISVFIALSGVSIIFYSLGIIAQQHFEREEERLQAIWEGRHHVNRLSQHVGRIAGHEHVRKFARGVKGLVQGDRRGGEFVPIENLTKFRMIRGKR